MKIGILTYHRSHNYGALLQAIALRKVLSDMGNEVFFIDYWPNYHRHMYALFSVKWLINRPGRKSKLLYIKDCLLHCSVRKQRKQNFDLFISHFILPYISSCDDSYDVIVHGSDQIWRKQPEIKVYNPIYFGVHSIKTQKKVSYAASMDLLPESDKDKNVISEYVSNLDVISVRELGLKDLIESMGYSCMLHLDPTLLLTGNEWIKLFNLQHVKEKGYVLYYHLQDNSFDIEQVRLFAKTKCMKLKILYSSAAKKSTDEEITIADPLDFVELICGADYVFTSSYHGLVFSLLFHKQVFAAFCKNSARAKSLLSQLSIEDRLLRPMSHIIPDVPDIDYKAVSTTLAEMRKNSYSYLYNISDL